MDPLPILTTTIRKTLGKAFNKATKALDNLMGLVDQTGEITIQSRIKQYLDNYSIPFVTIVVISNKIRITLQADDNGRNTLFFSSTKDWREKLDLHFLYGNIKTLPYSVNLKKRVVLYPGEELIGHCGKTTYHKKGDNYTIIDMENNRRSLVKEGTLFIFQEDKVFFSNLEALYLINLNPEWGEIHE